jgi:uncharacterized protein (DUF433 family)
MASKRIYTKDEVDRVLTLYSKGYTRDKITDEYKKIYKSKPVGHRFIQKVLDNADSNIINQHNIMMQELRKATPEARIDIDNDIDIDTAITNDYVSGKSIRYLSEKYKRSNRDIIKNIKENNNDVETIKTKHFKNLLNSSRNYNSRTGHELQQILAEYVDGVNFKDIMKSHSISRKQIGEFIKSQYEYERLITKRNKNKGITHVSKAEAPSITPEPEAEAEAIPRILDNISMKEFFGHYVKNPQYSIYARIDLIKDIAFDKYDALGVKTGRLNFTQVLTKGIITRSDYDGVLNIIERLYDEINPFKMPYIKDFETNTVYLYDPSTRTFPNFRETLK